MQTNLSSFVHDRTSLLTSLYNDTTNIVGHEQRQQQVKILEKELESILVQSMVMEIGALGIGGMVAAAALDWTGLGTKMKKLKKK
jgi:hypothetical protein